jgi:hypothetical protein
MRVKFEATDATGKVHKRSSRSRIYSHCVVIHFAAHLPSKFWPKGGVAACSPEWEGSRAMAERKATRWRKEPSVEAIEILDARQCEAQGPSRLQLRGLTGNSRAAASAMTISQSHDTQEAKSIARHLGLTLRLLRSGNYRVNFRDGNETTAYYTDDLEDAVNTAVEMARKREVANAGAEAELVAQPMILAAMNKCLAQSNKSRIGGKATKKREISQSSLVRQ